MSSFIIQLLIISVVGLMVQSAPVTATDDHLHKRSTSKSKQQSKTPERNLLCAAFSMKFKNFPNNLTVPAAPETHINIETVMNATFDHFSTLCKNYTIAMSLIYQVQDLLLNTNTTTPELSSDNIQNLSEIITYLQTMATALDDMQFYRNHCRCVRLTAAQYRIMYYVQHPNTTLIQALKGIKEFWKLIDGDYENQDLHCVKS